MSSPMLVLKDVARTYEQGGAPLSVLRNINLSVASGELVALVGPSGSGKSTLLHVAGLLDTPTSGSVTIGGEEATGASENKRTALRRSHVGFVYQFHHLLPEFSALENVMLPQMIAGVSRTNATAKAKDLLTLLGLEGRLNHRPAKLSGGEQQRVAIARALANDPVVLLADEPTGNLDAHTAEQVFALLLRVAKEKNLAALVATHNLDLAARMSRKVSLKDGALA